MVGGMGCDGCSRCLHWHLFIIFVIFDLHLLVRTFEGGGSAGFSSGRWLVLDHREKLNLVCSGEACLDTLVLLKKIKDLD